VSAMIDSLRKNIGSDFMASVVVFLVALPLCMGIAVASGVPPALGLITGIVGGIVVGAIAGSPLQVSGPAAGLTVLVYEIIQTHGIEMLGVIVLLAGLLQIGAGALKLGQWFRAISPAVIQGMLAGIGVLIVVGQIHVMVDDKPRGSGIENLLSIPEAIWKGIFPADGSSHHLAAAMGLLTIGVLLAWKYVPGRLKMIPAPLVAVVAAAGVTAAFALPIATVDVPANLLDVVTLPGAATFSGVSWSVLGAVLAIALIASAETLLSAAAVDQMHSGPRTQYNRELIAQGVGNTICGALGALPMTGVIVRSTANVSAGARTRMSAVIHGVWLLAFVALAPGLLRMIPTTSLAAVLVYTGFKLLIAPGTWRKLADHGKAEVAIYAATVIAIVATNLLEGVLVGVALAVVRLLYRMTPLDLDVRREPDGETVTVELRGSATFVRLPALAAALEGIEPGGTVRLDVERVVHVDLACLDLISTWRRQYTTTGGRVDLDWKRLESKCHSKPFVDATLRPQHRSTGRLAPASSR
jgi:MFS superfamily sulfate permease-like transporter